jgi:hypothetical protein
VHGKGFRESELKTVLAERRGAALAARASSIGFAGRSAESGERLGEGAAHPQPCRFMRARGWQIVV